MHDFEYKTLTAAPSEKMHVLFECRKREYDHVLNSSRAGEVNMFLQDRIGLMPNLVEEFR